MVINAGKYLHRRLDCAAKREGVSLEDYCIGAVAEAIGARQAEIDLERLLRNTDPTVTGTKLLRLNEPLIIIATASTLECGTAAQ